MCANSWMKFFFPVFPLFDCFGCDFLMGTSLPVASRTQIIFTQIPHYHTHGNAAIILFCYCGEQFLIAYLLKQGIFSVSEDKCVR